MTPNVNTGELAAYQNAFAQVLRGRAAVVDSLSAERTGLYKNLIHNNVFTFIDACFPVCRSIIKKSIWQQLCVAFMREHLCASPLFHHIPLEFISWLQSPQRFRHKAEPPFLTHLAHYEYSELQIQTAPDLAPNANLPNCAVLITPVQLVCYPYPVHTIGKTNVQVKLETTWLIIWRKIDGSAGFAQLSPNIYCLVEQLQNCQDLATLFLRWAKMCTPTPDANQFVQSLNALATLGVITVNQ